MATDKKRKMKTKTKPKDRHTNRIMIAVDLELHAQLKELAERNERPLTRQVRMVLIEALRKELLWPPRQENPNLLTDRRQ